MYKVLFMVKVGLVIVFQIFSILIITMNFLLIGCTNKPIVTKAPNVPIVTKEFYRVINPSILGFRGEESIEEMAETIQYRFGKDKERNQNYSESLEHWSDNGRGLIVFTMYGGSNDTINNEQHVLETVSFSNGTSEVIKYGVRHSCYHLPDKNKWTHNRCP